MVAGRAGGCDQTWTPPDPVLLSGPAPTGSWCEEAGWVGRLVLPLISPTQPDPRPHRWVWGAGVGGVARQGHRRGPGLVGA